LRGARALFGATALAAAFDFVALPEGALGAAAVRAAFVFAAALALGFAPPARTRGVAFPPPLFSAMRRSIGKAPPPGKGKRGGPGERDRPLRARVDPRAAAAGRRP
jgi:hypothetical protein